MDDDPMSKEPQEVGPGKPPREHRWKKGCASPNPSGRPPKRKQREMLQRYEQLRAIDGFAAIFNKIGDQELKGGDSRTLIEALVYNLFEFAFNPKTPARVRLGAKKLLLDYYRDSSRYLDEEQQKLFRNALDYKERWTRPFRIAEAKGLPGPSVLPHPNDVILHNDGSVKIVGPMWPEQQLGLEAAVIMRDRIEEALAVIAAGPLKSAEQKKIVQSVRKRWNAINNALPPRLQHSFPKI